MSIKLKKLWLYPIALIAVLLVFSPLCEAQVKSSGVKVGLSMVKMTGEGTDELEDAFELDLKSKLGFCAGGFLVFDLTPEIAFQPEVLLVQKGVKGEEEFFGETLTLNVSAMYIDIPLLFKYMLPAQGMVAPAVFAGPYFGFKVDDSVKVEYAGETETESMDAKSLDYGVVFGAGIEYPISTGKLVFDARYVLGLANINSEEDEGAVKNSGLMIMVGYAF